MATGAELSGEDRPNPHRLRRMPALDGVRGLAVAGVVLFHYPDTHTWVRGGMFGVDVFFVLSGFLVTAGLLDEVSATGTISRRRFFSRRAWRLVPALLAFLVVFVILSALFRHDGWFTSDPFGSPAGSSLSITDVFRGIGATLLYVYNVFLINNWTTAMPLAHLWTLAIEGQFYIGWALLLGWLLLHKPRFVLPMTLVAVVGSALLPWLVWNGGTGANIIYFGTGARLQQLLAGAVVAQLWHRGYFDRIPALVLRLVGAAGGITLLVMCFAVGNETFKYLGAETVAAAAASAVVACLLTAPERSLTSKVLSVAPLRWLGARSYAIYLWHWPLAVWTNQLPHSWGVPLGIGSSLVLAELSWRLVEAPVARATRPRKQPAPPQSILQ